MSNAIKVRVVNGKLIGDAPAGPPEGTEFELVLADVEDDMNEGELDVLNAVLEASIKQAKAGVGVDAAELHRRIRRT